MNKKQKIIVSIVGITIVLLALLGITYAYYLTRIEGNTNTNSISITTADLKLVYSENSPEIITENNIMPGTTIGEKTFTVSNTGNSAVEDYKVVLEYAVIENVVPSVFVRPQDFEITMTCVSKNIQTNNVSGTCSGYTGKWNNESFEMTTNDINAGIKHEYTLTIFYANPDIDQSDDMGKNLNLKVQIYGANETSTITGTINNVDETYAMKLNSNPKISTIKNVGTKENPKYQYKFIGVEHNSGDDSHTLTLVNKSNVEQSTGNITIKKGTNASIDGSTITVKDNQSNIYLTTSNGSTLTNSATFNPYSNNTNSLAYNIIKNAKDNKNGTELLNTPETNVAEEKSYTKGTGKFEIEQELDLSGKEWYYGSTYGDAQPWNGGSMEGSTTTCSSTIEKKYISYPEVGESWYVKSCKSETIAIVGINEEMEYESSIQTAQDDYGTSYYFRGNPIDNFVTFAGMCWRIVRIDGNGNTKLILEDQDEVCSTTMNGNWDIEASDGTNITMNGAEPYRVGNFGYDDSTGKYKMSYLNPVDNPNRAMVNAFKYFQTNTLTNKISSTYENKSLSDYLVSGNWCLNEKAYSDTTGTTILENPTYTSSFYYDSYVRLYGKTIKEPTLKCPVEPLYKFDDNQDGVISSNETDMYVGTITADEIVYAGGKVYEGNSNYYLINNWQATNLKYFWSLSPSDFNGFNDRAFFVSSSGSLRDDLYVSSSSDYGAFRPSVSLVSSAVISSGEGTLEKPYVIG